MMKALHTIAYPQSKDLSAAQTAFNAANERLLNTNFRMLQDAIYELDVRDEATLDYVVGQGLSGIWFYRLWNSGAVEAWAKTESEEIVFTVAAGSLYIHTKEIDLPLLFDSVDYAGVQAVSVNAVMASVKEFDAESIAVNLLSATNSTVTLSFFAHVIGRV